MRDPNTGLFPASSASPDVPKLSTERQSQNHTAEVPSLSQARL